MKVKDLSNTIIEQLVQLECKNILPILSSVGLKLTEKDMSDQIQFFKDSDIVLSLENEQVNGFAIYETKLDSVMIITFNLRKFNSAEVLQDLLKQILKKLEGSSINLINSRAHLTNKKSINFHRRMNFKILNSTEHHFEFQIEKEELMQVVNRRLDRLQPATKTKKAAHRAAVTTPYSFKRNQIP